MPLAATLATAGVFDAFGGAAKTDALLHGHSYSGHAIGLSAAAAALAIFDDPAANPALCAPAHLRADRSTTAPTPQQEVSSCVQAAAAVVGGREMDAAEGAEEPRVGSCVEAAAADVGGRELRAAGGAGGAGAGSSAAGEPSSACVDGRGRLEPGSGPGGSTSAAGGGGRAAGGAGGLGLSAQGVGCACEQPCGRLVELWDPAATAALSMRPDVARVVAIGAALFPVDVMRALLLWYSCMVHRKYFQART